MSTEKSSTALRTIGEVADLLGVQSHVLRFWEMQFPQIKPQKQRGGRRYYRPQDVELLLQVKQLLYVEGFTIEGAKKRLLGGEEVRVHTPPVQTETKPLQSSLEGLHRELLAMREILLRKA